MSKLKQKKDNPYSQLVSDLVSGRLSLTIVMMAIKESIRQNKEIPEAVKTLVAPHGDVGSGVVDKAFHIIKSVVSETEIAYRRGMCEGEGNGKKEIDNLKQKIKELER